MLPTHVDTLAVFTTNRGPGLIQDHVDAIRHAHDGTLLVVVVVDNLAAGKAYHETETHVLVKSEIEGGNIRLSGFKNNEGVQWAIDQGIDFTSVFFLDDDCLPIGRGLDTWALGILESNAADLLGVEDRVSYQQEWAAARSSLEGWMPKEAQRITSVVSLNAITVFYAGCWLSGAMAKTMRARNLLVPPDCKNWWTWPDVYISWVVHLLGGYQVTHGSMNRPKAPLYLNHKNHMASAPDPAILHPDFKLYHTIKFITGVSEQEIRERYRLIREAK